MNITHPSLQGIVQKSFVVLVVLLALLSLVPLYFGVLTSFKPSSSGGAVSLIPENLTLDNYKYLFTRTRILRWFFNSLFTSTLAAAIIVYLSALAGYPLAKKKFPGVKWLFWIIIVFMTIPKEALLLPLFMMMKEYHLFNTYYGIILPALAWPFAVFLMKQFISTIPSDLFDAAEIDGCGPLRLFHSILLPIIKPALGALSIFAFVYVWNDYIWQLIVITSLEMKTLPLGVAGLQEQSASDAVNYGQLMAGSTLGAIPLLAVFLFFQKYFTSGITMGAVKG
ncbi:carbohydrate ABC transporter permease [Paenibacillus radicis (ex Xue et al. 2023)]|uniref:Carbohydrate ABC transporter permease n=1 Tax=Paenibacillus radicis (ex Xue et al. 2023) TaxID=2972489 RepID=A0ABT1YA17_9BACL|nr:carbohydrate ABC transporter permease [Paenibacillus radicis (ex Xue et al. 2023)]MCR8630031.1 carbohydrate ABC transporter permease [Paenibacillus radicis (ex Xue et al. 2023)]